MTEEEKLHEMLDWERGQEAKIDTLVCKIDDAEQVLAKLQSELATERYSMAGLQDTIREQYEAVLRGYKLQALSDGDGILLGGK